MPSSAHPHVEPRQPRADSRPGTNPPVFAWLPRGKGRSSLLIARDAALSSGLIRIDNLDTPLHLPERPFETGAWFWTWEDEQGRGPVHSFEITADSVVLEVPSAAEWKNRIPVGHPRFLVRPETAETLRASIAVERADTVAEIVRLADEVLAEPHFLAEPPQPADPKVDHAGFIRDFLKAMWDSRRFMKGAETLALAYLATRRVEYGRAARDRVLSVAVWDPAGPTSLEANDEAHMSILWYGASAADWTWELFTDEERARIVACMRARGRSTYEHVRHSGVYGVDKFDSHAGRQIVFLGLLSLAFYHEIPEAAEWLNFLRPVLCGVWPVWAGDDGAWAEGPAYGMTYVSVMTLFASALKQAVGVDLYRRPFWSGHLAWRRKIWPAYAEWIGFGDHNECWDVFWRSHADVCEVIARETGSAGYAPYIEELRAAAADHCRPAPSERQLKGLHPLRLLAPAPLAKDDAARPAGKDMLTVYPTAGWAAIRSNPADTGADVAFYFRSSPFGSISHSHAANNDFILHVAGKVMMMPSGFYDGYATPHHAHWVWHTKSHNCLTISDAGQRMRSPEAVGRVASALENDSVVALHGEADASYPGILSRCRRHVVFFKEARCILLIDDVELTPDTVGAVQWNAHSWAPFVVDSAARTFRLVRDHAELEGFVLHHGDGYFKTSSGWDPAPNRRFENLPWEEQYHLRYSPLEMIAPRRRLGVLLRLEAPAWPAAAVSAAKEGTVETAKIGDSVHIEIPSVADGGEIVARIRIADTCYVVHDERGLQPA